MVVAGLCVAVLALWLLRRAPPAPTPTEQEYASGNAALRRRDYARALAHYSRAIEFSHDFMPAFLKRGMAELSLLKYDEALRDYEKAISLEPLDPEGYFARGVLRWVLGQPDSAALDFAKAIELDPDDKIYYDRLSTALYEAGRDTEVEAVYERAYRGQPERDWALWGWLEAIHALDDYARLSGVCAKLSTDGRPNAALSYHLGLIAFQEKRYAHAARLVEDAARLDPEQTPEYSNTMLWIAHQKLGNTELAQRFRQRMDEIAGSEPH